MKLGKRHQLRLRRAREQLTALQHALQNAGSETQRARLRLEIVDTQHIIDQLGGAVSDDYVSPENETTPLEQLSGPNDPPAPVRIHETPPKVRVHGDELVKMLTSVLRDLRGRDSRSEAARQLTAWCRAALNIEVK